MKMAALTEVYSPALGIPVERAEITGSAAELKMLRDLCNAVLAAGERASVTATRETVQGGGDIKARGMELTINLRERWEQ